MNVSVTNHALVDEERRYRLLTSVEIFPFDSSYTKLKYVVVSGKGRSYVVSEQLKDALLLFDGSRTLGEIAHLISQKQGVAVSEEHVRRILSEFIIPYGLIEAENPVIDVPIANKKSSFDFTLRLPLISPQAIAPVVNRLLWLFKLPVAIATIAIICLMHLAFYQNWFLSRPETSFEPSAWLILYTLALITALIHELGHATACRAYRCNHGVIGLCIYLIFPAFYVNLSNIWRLPSRQRAIIDLGGMYFQLITTIPIFFLFLLTRSPYYCATIYSVDLMVLISFNPIFKFDGYWLFVDLSGLVNLHSQALRLTKETIMWSFGFSKQIQVLEKVTTVGKRLLLFSYTIVGFAILVSFLLLLITAAPAQLARLIHNSYELLLSIQGGSADIVANAARLMGSLIFVLFLYRLLWQMLFKPLKRRASRKSQ